MHAVAHRPRCNTSRARERLRRTSMTHAPSSPYPRHTRKELVPLYRPHIDSLHTPHNSAQPTTNNNHNNHNNDYKCSHTCGRSEERRVGKERRTEITRGRTTCTRLRIAPAAIRLEHANASDARR